jgi:hypothetical protein
MLGSSALALVAALLVMAPRSALAGDPVRPNGPPAKSASDTVQAKSSGKAKPDQAIPEAPAAGARKKTPSRIIPDADPTPAGRQAPDQPWETTFLVYNTSPYRVWQYQTAGGPRGYR